VVLRLLGISSGRGADEFLDLNFSFGFEGLRAFVIDDVPQSTKRFA